MSYWRENNIRNNHGDEYAYSLDYRIDDDGNLVVTVDEKMPQPYEPSDIYIGVYNSLEFTLCDEDLAAGYEEYFIADYCHERGYLITQRDVDCLNENGEVSISPLGHDWDEGIKELIDNYLKGE